MAASGLQVWGRGQGPDFLGKTARAQAMRKVCSRPSASDFFPTVHLSMVNSVPQIHVPLKPQRMPWL